MHPDTKCIETDCPLNLGAKPYVRKKSQIVFVGAGYRVLLAATDSDCAQPSSIEPYR
jgi:hypothetical protein